MTAQHRISCFLSAIFSVLLVGTRMLAGTPDRPNFVVILADDQGWAGCNVAMEPTIDKAHSPWFVTRNLQRLARSGMRFSNGYASAPKCSPSRAGLLTGSSPARLRFTENGKGPDQEEYSKSLGGAVICPNEVAQLGTEFPTIGEFLKEHAPHYVTAHLGKWHVGRIGNGPPERGFDVSDGPTSNFDGLPTAKNRDGTMRTNFTEDNPKQIFSLSQRAAKFLRARGEDQHPFYLQISHYAVHGPYHARRETTQKVAARKGNPAGLKEDYAAMTQDLDEGVGIVLDAIKQAGLAETTYVVYTSDNGGYKNLHCNGPLAKGKTWCWEGGTRVPWIIAGPGIEANSICHTPIVGWDVFPTVADAIGLAEHVPNTVDGGSLLPLLSDPQMDHVNRPAEVLCFHVARYMTEGRGSRGPTSVPHSSIRQGDWKLIRQYDTPGLKGPATHLFNLREDLGETQNLAAEMPEKVNQLESQLDQWLVSVNASIPRPNPDYNDRRRRTKTAREARSSASEK